MFLKGLIAAAFESSEPLHLLRLMGVSAPSLHRQSTLIVTSGLSYLLFIYTPVAVHSVRVAYDITSFQLCNLHVSDGCYQWNYISEYQAFHKEQTLLFRIYITMALVLSNIQWYPNCSVCMWVTSSSSVTFTQFPN